MTEETKQIVEETPEEKPGRNYVAQAWLVLLLAIIFGAGLTFVQLSLNERIKENKRQETFSQIPQLVPGSESGEDAEILGKPVYRAMGTDGQVGWVIPANGQGFADKIEILIGVNSDVSQITGVYVLEQKETPGLGDKIRDEEWRSQYTDKWTTTPVEVIKSGSAAENQVVAVTGATISSVAVTDIVNKTLAEMKEELVKNVKQVIDYGK